jgi:hypothetical protein
MVVLSSDSDFINYAMKCYDNPSVSVEAFQEDLNRLDSLSRIFSRFENSGEINERLALNHFIILFNVFGEGTVHLLFYKLKTEYVTYIKTFLIYLNRMPDRFTEVPINNVIANKLRVL